MTRPTILVAAVFMLTATAIFAYFASPEKSSPAGLVSATRKEQLRELEKLRIEGIRHVTEKKFDRAVEIFLRLSYVNRHDPFAYRQLAPIYKEMGDADFTRVMTDAMRRRPDSADLDRTLGAVLYYAGRVDLAASHIDSYLNAHPDDVCARFYRGAILAKTGSVDEAITVLSGVIAIEPTHHYAYLELQNLYDKRGDYDMAKKMLGLALKYDPEKDAGICCGLPPDSEAATKR